METLPRPCRPGQERGGVEERVARAVGGKFGEPLPTPNKPHSVVQQPSKGARPSDTKGSSPSPSTRSPSPTLEELKDRLEEIKESLEHKFSLRPEEFVMLKRLSEDIKKLEGPMAKELLQGLESKWSKEMRQRRLI